MNIEFTNSPKSSDVDFLSHKIYQEAPEFGMPNFWAFFIRDAEEQIIAGCNGDIMFERIYTDQLWVAKEYRKVGVGKKLMDKVHEYGKQNGCTKATVSTMSFQGAKEFYEKLGYVVNFKRDGYVENSSCLFLSREL